MTKFLLCFLFPFTVFAVPEKESCEIQSLRRLPEILIFGLGGVKDWREIYPGEFLPARNEGRKLRAQLFKLGRTHKAPLVSQSFLTLDGRVTDQYTPALKNVVDQKNKVFGIESEMAVVLAENYKVMDAHSKDRLKDAPYARLLQFFFHALKYPSLRNVFGDLYRKSETLGLPELKMNIRRINNGVAEIEKNMVLVLLRDVRPSRQRSKPILKVGWPGRCESSPPRGRWSEKSSNPCINNW